MHSGFEWLTDQCPELLQAGADKLEQVAHDKLESGKPITQDDASRISSAETQVTGQRVKGGLSAQAQSAAAKAKQAGLTE